jgi:hypothetical protein
MWSPGYLRTRLHTRPLSQTRFIHSHTTAGILPIHCQWCFLPSLICAHNCLVATMLTRALSSCVAGLDFQSADTSGPPRRVTRQRDASPLEKGVSEHLSWMELTQMSAQRPQGSQLKTQKQRIVLAR